MKSYKDPSFQDRVGRAAEAKQKALDKLRSKPPVDPELIAQRQAARARREAAEAEKRASKKAAEESAREARDAAAASAAEADRAVEAEAAAKAAAVPPPPTEAERKAARDARYAARKNRK